MRVARADRRLGRRRRAHAHEGRRAAPTAPFHLGDAEDNPAGGDKGLLASRLELHETEAVKGLHTVRPDSYDGSSENGSEERRAGA